MTWLQRYRVRHYVRNSIWLLPAAVGYSGKECHAQGQAERGAADGESNGDWSGSRGPPGAVP
jgi:hypothetical protein